MMNSSGFIKGMVTGAAIGAVAALVFDPITPRDRKRMKRKAAGMYRNIGGIVDNVMSVRH